MKKYLIAILLTLMAGQSAMAKGDSLSTELKIASFFCSAEGEFKISVNYLNNFVSANINGTHYQGLNQQQPHFYVAKLEANTIKVVEHYRINLLAHEKLGPPFALELNQFDGSVETHLLSCKPKQ